MRNLFISSLVPTCRILIDAWFISESKPYDSDEHHLRVIYPNNSVRKKLLEFLRNNTVF